MIIVENGVTKLLTMPITQLNNICKNHDFVLSVKDFPGVPDYMKSLNEVFPEAIMDNLREFCRVSIRPNRYFDAYVEYNGQEGSFVPSCTVKGITITTTDDLAEMDRYLDNLSAMIDALNNLL